MTYDLASLVATTPTQCGIARLRVSPWLSRGHVLRVRTDTFDAPVIVVSRDDIATLRQAVRNGHQSNADVDQALADKGDAFCEAR